MTFEEYIKNPMGGKNAVIAHKEMYRTMYTEKFDRIMVREANKVDYKIYKQKEEFYVHIKVPSEVIDKFYYDVVIHFTPSKRLPSLSLSDYETEFFSNDPAFVFTFAHAFIKNKMFVEDLKPRMSRKAVTDRAKEKNPKDETGYVKSIYFAFLIMKAKGLFNKAFATSASIPYNKNGLLSTVEDADKKIDARQLEAEKLATAKQKAKQAFRDETKRDLKKQVSDADEGQSNTMSRVPGISYTKRTTTSKSSTTIGKVNTIKKTKRIR